MIQKVSYYLAGKPSEVHAVLPANGIIGTLPFGKIRTCMEEVLAIANKTQCKETIAFAHGEVTLPGITNEIRIEIVDVDLVGIERKYYFSQPFLGRALQRIKPQTRILCRGTDTSAETLIEQLKQFGKLDLPPLRQRENMSARIVRTEGVLFADEKKIGASNSYGYPSSSELILLNSQSLFAPRPLQETEFKAEEIYYVLFGNAVQIYWKALETLILATPSNIEIFYELGKVLRKRMQEYNVRIEGSIVERK